MKSSTSMLVLAQFASTGAKLALFVLLMQFGGFEVAGSYTYALSVITPTFIFFGLSLRQIYVTSPSELQFGHFLFLRLVYGILGILIVILIATFTRPEMLPLFAAMGVFRFVESLIDIRIASFQRVSRVTLMALSTLLQALFMTGSLALAFMLTENIVQSVVMGSVLGVLLYFVLTKLDSTSGSKNRLAVPSRRAAYKIVKSGLLLSLSSFSVSLGTSVPVLVLGFYHNTAAVGAYSSIYHISSVSNILFSAVTQAELRVFAKLAVQGRYTTFMQRARKFSVALSLVGVFGTVIIYFFGIEIFTVIFGQDFSGYKLALVLMGLTVCFSPFSFFLDAQLTALQKFSVQTTISLCVLVFTVLCSLLLVPDHAVFGATLVVFTTMLLRNVVKSFVLSRVIRDAN